MESEYSGISLAQTLSGPKVQLISLSQTVSAIFTSQSSDSWLRLGGCSRQWAGPVTLLAARSSLPWYPPYWSSTHCRPRWAGLADWCCNKVLLRYFFLSSFPHTQSVHKGAVLATLLEFVKLAHHFSSSEEGTVKTSKLHNRLQLTSLPPSLPPPSTLSLTVSSPLLPYKAALSALLMSILDKESHAPLRVVAIATLSQLLEVPGLLEAEEVCVCVCVCVCVQAFVLFERLKCGLCIYHR